MRVSFQATTRMALRLSITRLICGHPSAWITLRTKVEVSNTFLCRSRSSRRILTMTDDSSASTRFDGPSSKVSSCNLRGCGFHLPHANMHTHIQRLGMYRVQFFTEYRVLRR